MQQKLIFISSVIKMVSNLKNLDAIVELAGQKTKGLEVYLASTCFC